MKILTFLSIARWNRMIVRSQIRRSRPTRTISALVTLTLMLTASSAIADDDIKDSVCHDAIQGKIAWNYDGSTRWAVRNIRELCAGALDSEAPARCFKRVMHDGVNWGSGTRWEWENAVSLCAGTRNAGSRIDCFQERVSGGMGWKPAINQCAAGGDDDRGACAASIDRRHGSLGGGSGELGTPVSTVRTNPGNTGKRREYDGGHIYCSSDTGAHPIFTGPIWDEFADQKWEQGKLGYPVEGPKTNPDRTGKRQKFEGGLIYWHPDTGAHTILNGTIWERWADQRWEQGNLGYPIANRERTPDGKGWMQHFEGGVIATNARGNVRRLRHCNDTAKHNIRQAVLFLELNLQSLKKDFKLADRKPKRRRIRRKMNRKISKLKFSCAERVLCRPEADRIAMKAGIRKIRLCYDKISSYSFCSFAGVVGHEFGHLAKIPKKRLGRHHRKGDDRVYKFERFVRGLCTGTRWQRDLSPLPP